jgi:fructose-1,6-bisphosphatase/inositol monophosphatase family enzyme
VQNQVEVKQLREVCLRLAQEGARIARRMQRVDIPRHLKADASIVTEADPMVERALIEAIRRDYPEDAIIAEESSGIARGADPTHAERFWIIDPIDGTRSFARGLPWYSCSVAVTDRHTPIAGAVVEAGTGMQFSAAAGQGAYCNGAAVRVAGADPGKDILVAVPSKHRLPLPEPLVRWCNECVWRNYGSSALHLSLVAAGLLDASVVLEAKIWDIAAAGLAALEAGALVTDLDGRPTFPMDIAAHATNPQVLAVLGASPACHAKLLATIHQ